MTSVERLAHDGIKIGIEFGSNGVCWFSFWLGFTEWLGHIDWLSCIGVNDGIEAKVKGGGVFPFWIGIAGWMLTVGVGCVVESGVKFVFNGFRTLLVKVRCS